MTRGPHPGLWQPGDEPGGRQLGPAVRRRWPPGLDLEGGGRLPEVTVAYETWGELDADRGNAVLVLHALTGDSHAAGPAGPGHPTAGWWDGMIGPGAAHRHRPLLRGLPQRARRLPGHHRSGVAGSRRPALRLALPAGDHPGPGGGGGRAGRPPGHRPVGRRGRRLDGRHAGPRVVRGPSRPGAPGRGAGRGGHGHRRADRPVLAADPGHPVRPGLRRRRLLRHRGPAHGRAGPGPWDRPVLATGPTSSSRAGSAGPPRTRRTR